MMALPSLVKATFSAPRPFSFFVKRAERESHFFFGAGAAGAGGGGAGAGAGGGVAGGGGSPLIRRHGGVGGCW